MVITDDELLAQKIKQLDKLNCVVNLIRSIFLLLAVTKIYDECEISLD